MSDEMRSSQSIDRINAHPLIQCQLTMLNVELLTSKAMKTNN